MDKPQEGDRTIEWMQKIHHLTEGVIRRSIASMGFEKGDNGLDVACGIGYQKKCIAPPLLKGAAFMAKIGILSCEKIKDIHCMGCIKCYKACSEKVGGFAEHDDEIEIVFWAGCGGCPGLFMPKMVILDEMVNHLGREYDVVHIGTCITKAVGTAGCPLDLEDMKKKIEGKWGKKVIIGTHPW